jgi:hypothetical protein
MICKLTRVREGGSIGGGGQYNKFRYNLGKPRFLSAAAETATVGGVSRWTVRDVPLTRNTIAVVMLLNGTRVVGTANSELL